MKKLAALVFILIGLAGCRHSNVIDSTYPWPSSGVDEADSLMLRFENLRSRLTTTDVERREIVNRFCSISAKYPANDILRMRSLYLEACTLLRTDPKKAHTFVSEGMAGLDSASSPYDWFCLRTLKLPYEGNIYDRYVLARENCHFFKKVDSEAEYGRNLVILGNVMTNLRDVDKALEYYDRAAEIFRRHGMTNEWNAIRLNKIPFVKPEKVGAYVDSLLDDPGIRKNPKLYFVALQNAIFMLDRNELLDSAINLARRERINRNDYMMILVFKAMHLVDEGRPGEALVLTDELRREMSHNQLISRYQPDTHLYLADIYAANGLKDSCISELRQSIVWNDSVFVEMNYPGIYSTETKARIEIAEQNIRLEKRYLVMWWVLSILILLAVAGLIYHKVQKRHERRKYELDLLDEKLESERKVALAQSSVLKESDRMIDEFSAALRTLKESGRVGDDVEKELSRIIKAFRSNDESRKGYLKMNRELDNKFTLRLKEDFPDLSESQLRLAALLATGVGSHQLCSILNISSKSLYTSRYRLRSRLGLSKDESLEDFLRRYDQRPE